MDDENIELLNKIEEETRDRLSRSRKCPSFLSLDSLIDIVFGHIGQLLDFKNEHRAMEQMVSICSQVYYYAYGKENKHSKKELERHRYHKESLSKKAKELKSLLWDKRSWPNDKELESLHGILEQMIDDPYKYAKPPAQIPLATYSKEYTKDLIIMTLSDRFDKVKGVRAANRVLSEIDTLFRNG